MGGVAPFGAARGGSLLLLGHLPIRVFFRRNFLSPIPPTFVSLFRYSGTHLAKPDGETRIETKEGGHKTVAVAPRQIKRQRRRQGRKRFRENGV
jgi:hypothetical protein